MAIERNLKFPIKNKKKWIITGAIGYVGFKICELLQYSTDRVVAIDNNFKSFEVEKLVSWGIEFYHRDLFNCQNLLDDADYCIHCAGITDVAIVASQSTPEKDALIMKVGVDGTREIFKYLPGKCKIVFLSTHVIYENLKERILNITEEHPPCPNLAYSTSKYLSEQDLINGNKNYIIIRLGSVYGLPATRWRIIVNLFAKNTVTEGKIILFGSDCIKPIVGIEDVARAIMFLIQKNFNREIFNLVNENITIKEIAQICKEFSSKLDIQEIDGEIPNKGYGLSNEKLLKTGFKFKQNVKDEIGRMIKVWSNKIMLY